MDYECPFCGADLHLEIEPGEGPLDSECEVCGNDIYEDALREWRDGVIDSVYDLFDMMR